MCIIQFMVDSPMLTEFAELVTAKCQHLLIVGGGQLHLL